MLFLYAFINYLEISIRGCYCNFQDAKLCSDESKRMGRVARRSLKAPHGDADALTTYLYMSNCSMIYFKHTLSKGPSCLAHRWVGQPQMTQEPNIRTPMPENLPKKSTHIELHSIRIVILNAWIAATRGVLGAASDKNGSTDAAKASHAGAGQLQEQLPRHDHCIPAA